MLLPELPITAEWHATRPGETEPLVSEDGVRVQRAIETQGDGFRIRVRFVNESGGPVSLHSLSPAVIEGESDWFSAGLDGWALWVQGREMTSATLTHRFGRGELHESFEDSFRAETEQGIGYRSDLMTVLHHPETGRTLLIGFVTTARQFGEIVLTCSADERRLLRIDARCLTDGVEIADGGTLESESVVLLAGTDPLALVDGYAQILARAMGARVPERVPSGWCSWYFYYNRVTERDVLGNLVALQTGDYRVDYVQIDDGFQSATGDWLTPNEKFPRGMKFLADRIRDAGYRPGVWLAPLVMHRDSRVLAEHPEFAVRDQRGEIIWSDIWLGPCAALDCTNPAALSWLHDVIRTVVQEWGFSFLKLDALASACQPGARYHAPGTTAAMNLRLGLELIRAAAGAETFILGCSCPFAPAIGLVDAMRVGPDVEARWFAGTQPSVRHALRLSLQRFWMHRRLWLNDPDCLTVRQSGSTLTDDEVRFLATGIALSGGLTVLSEDLSAVTPERAAIARRVLPATGVAARPLDLFERETPAIWRLPRVDGAALAFLNWDDAPADLHAEVARSGAVTADGAVERWSEVARRVPDGALAEAGIPPHSARVVRLYQGSAPAPGGHILA